MGLLIVQQHHIGEYAASVGFAFNYQVLHFNLHIFEIVRGL